MNKKNIMHEEREIRNSVLDKDKNQMVENKLDMRYIKQ